MDRLHTTIKFSFIALILLPGLALTAFSQEQITVPFSDPARPGTVIVELLSGGISVEGYDGAEVIIDVTSQSNAGSRTPDQSRGLQRIPNTLSGLTVEERNNRISIEGGPFARVSNIAIRVPYETSLRLQSVNGTVIEVSDVRGEIEAENNNGPIRVTNISGTAVLYSLNGEIVATFDDIAGDSPMAFSTLNGAIDITLPAETRATVRMKTNNGDVYSDFEIELASRVGDNVSTSGGSGGQLRIRIDDTIIGTINGGGQEFQFTTLNGNIYLRRGN